MKEPIRIQSRYGRIVTLADYVRRVNEPPPTPSAAQALAEILSALRALRMSTPGAQARLDRAEQAGHEALVENAKKITA